MPFLKPLPFPDESPTERLPIRVPFARSVIPARNPQPARQSQTRAAVPHVDRIVLYPYGALANPAQRAECSRLVERCGGDRLRVFDQDQGSIDRFLAHAEKIRAVREGSSPVAVVITRTSPAVLTIVVARRRMESDLPALRRALWIVYFQPESDPFFWEAAHELGVLSGAPSTAPTWIGPGDSSYLVLSPSLPEDLDLGRRSAEALCGR